MRGKSRNHKRLWSAILLVLVPGAAIVIFSFVEANALPNDPVKRSVIELVPFTEWSVGKGISAYRTKGVRHRVEERVSYRFGPLTFNIWRDETPSGVLLFGK
jgi:hypothetical protein